MKGLGLVITIALAIILTFIFGSRAYSSYKGKYIPTVVYPNFQPNPDNPPIKWISKVCYKSKGAFIAGEKINVNIEFKIVNNSFYEKVKNKKITYLFWNSFKYPLNITASFPEGGGCSKIIDDKVVKMNCDIVYNMPGEYGYKILFDEPSIPGYSNNHIIDIAPLETGLQLHNSNLILCLTYVAILLSSLGILTAISLRIFL